MTLVHVVSCGMQSPAQCRAFALATLLLLSTVGASTAPPQAPSDADAQLARVAGAYFDEALRASPSWATSLGVHRFDDRLDDAGASAWAASLARDRRYLTRLAGIAPAALTPRGAVDRTMLVDHLHDDLLLNGTMALWRHKPGAYTDIASGATYGLIERNFAPPVMRLRDVVAREEDFPRLFAQARANLTGVDATTARLAVEDSSGLADLVQHAIPAAFAGVGDPVQRSRFRHATALALNATNGFVRYLRATWVAHPRGTFAIGAANYAARLRYEEGFQIPLPRYAAIGERALAQTRAELIATAHAIGPHADVRSVLAAVERQHPSSATLIPAAQSDLVRLRRFIVTHHIIALAADAAISVTVTPPFMRSQVVAAMDAPGPFERVATQAYYYVTPVDPSDPPAVQQAYLATFNDFERPIVSAHEVYPATSSTSPSTGSCR